MLKIWTLKGLYTLFQVTLFYRVIYFRFTTVPLEIWIIYWCFYLWKLFIIICGSTEILLHIQWEKSIRITHCWSWKNDVIFHIIDQIKFWMVPSWIGLVIIKRICSFKEGNKKHIFFSSINNIYFLFSSIKRGNIM